MCSNFECGSLTCINEICEIRLCDADVPSNIQCSEENGKAKNACKGNPCQNPCLERVRPLSQLILRSVS